MTFHEWRPQTRRNKIALCIALFSLLMMIGLNFLPDEPMQFSNEPLPTKSFAFTLWPMIFEIIEKSLRNFKGVSELFIPSITIVFLVCLQLLMIPAWRIFSQLIVLRNISVLICVIGSATLANLIHDNPYITWDSHFQYYLILVNFLLTIISLIILKKELIQIDSMNNEFKTSY